LEPVTREVGEAAVVRAGWGHGGSLGINAVVPKFEPSVCVPSSRG